MSEPVFVALLFADRVIEEVSHKKGIIGTFTTFNSPQFPAMFPPWFIYSAVTNLDPEQKHSFTISVASKDTQLVIFSANGELQVQEFATVPEFVVLVQAVFPKEGVYIVSLAVNGHELASRILEVKRIPMTGGV